MKNKDVHQECIFEEAIKEYCSIDDVSIKIIADKWNIAYWSLYDRLRERNLIHKASAPLRKATPDIIDQIVKEYQRNESCSLKTLAKKYGICYSTVSRWLKRSGIAIRKQPKHPLDEKKLEKALECYRNGMNAVNAAKESDIGKNSFLKYLKRYCLLKKEVIIQKDIKYNSDFFNELDTEEKAYWFGFIYADGCVRLGDHCGSVTIEISIQDEKHLKKFLNSIDSNKEIKYRTRSLPSGNTSSVCSVTINSTNMAFALIDKGCVPNKTYEGKIQSNIFSSSKLKAAFLRGYFDGDGYISVNKKSVSSMSYVIHNYKVMNYVLKMIIEETGVIPQVRYESDNKKNGAYRLRIMNKNDFFKFFNYIYKDATIYLDRKYERFLAHSRPEPKAV